MSNAMRFGKRSLAGVAAGALGVGMLAGLATGTAQAAATDAATVSFNLPSYTLNVTGVSVDDTIPATIEVLDSNGNVATTAANRRLELTVTSPATAIVADLIAVGINDDTAGYGTTVNYTGADIVANDDILGIGAYDGTSFINWNQLITSGNSAAGTYTVTAKLINTANGATLSTATMPVQVVSEAGKPAATIAFINSSLNPLNAYSFTQTSVVDTTPQAWRLAMLNSTGGAYLDDTGPVITATNANYIATAAWSNAASGWDTKSGVYTYTQGTATAKWAAVSAGTMTATFANSTGSSSKTVPVYLGNAFSGTPDVTLAAPANAFETSTDDSWQVKPGTTSLSFGITMPAVSSNSTVPWRVVSSAGSTGASIASAGVAPITVDQAAASIQLSADAAAAGEFITFAAFDDSTGGLSDTVTVNFVTPAPLLTAETPLGKVSTAVPATGTITDQYGDVLAGTWAISLKAGTVTNCTSGTNLATATAAADGSYSITIPATSAPATTSSVDFTMCASNGLTTTYDQFAVEYTTTGGVTSLVLTNDVTANAALMPVVNLPSLGAVTVAGSTAQTVAVGSVPTQTVINAADNSFQLTAAVTPNAPMTFTTSEGAFVTSKTTGSILWNQGVTSYTSPSGATASVSVYATKPGAHTVTVTAGTTTSTYTFYAGVNSASIRTVTAEKAEITLAKNSFVATTATVKDVFGNVVPSAAFTPSLLGPGSISPNVASTAGALGGTAPGVATVYYTSPDAEGQAGVVWTVTPETTDAIPGAPAAVTSATTTVKISGATPPSDKTIVIVGERATVSGKPGIRIEGATTGFAAGAAVKPWVRFPGETSYSAGTARPTVSALGDFSWQRKTGKKTYVYFTSADDVVKSNRVIIAAN